MHVVFLFCSVLGVGGLFFRQPSPTICVQNWLIGGWQSFVAVDSSANSCFFILWCTDGVVFVIVFVLFSCLVFVVLVVVC